VSTSSLSESRTSNGLTTSTSEHRHESGSKAARSPLGAATPRPRAPPSMFSSGSPPRCIAHRPAAVRRATDTAWQPSMPRERHTDESPTELLAAPPAGRHHLQR
jgi:hypothetical protein